MSRDPRPSFPASLPAPAPADGSAEPERSPREPAGTRARDVGSRSVAGRLAALSRETAARRDTTTLREEVRLLGEALGFLSARLARLEGDDSGAAPRESPASESPIARLWARAPFAARQAFVCALLPEVHPLAQRLREAKGLLDVWESPECPEAWLEQYPEVFVAAYEALAQPATSGEPSDEEALAFPLLREARERVDRRLDAVGLEWIAPEPNSPLGEEHVVEGEVNAPGVRAGRVAACLRRGFRRHGRVRVPARVVRQAAEGAPGRPSPSAASPPPGSAETSERVAAPASAAGAPVSVPAAPPAGTDWPEWLRALHLRAPGAPEPVEALLQGLRRLIEVPPEVEPEDEFLRECLEALPPVLGPYAVGADGPAGAAWRDTAQQVRGELETWLERRFSVWLIAPAIGAEFDAEAMRSSGTRNTFHPHEVGHVARLERVGIRRDERVLIPARVQQFAREES